ncbi:MAG: PorV/PorQ family protein [candidate division Zixibacteria bacterium]|nr:PorV/PorQ family protein [candidate division Zixibacteria bacterium]
MGILKFYRVFILCLIMFSPAIAEKYAGEFLYLGVGGRALALGSAYIASDGDAFSSYYNPAGLTKIQDYQAAFMHSETFGALLNHDYLTAAKRYGESAAAVSLYYLGGGGILVTEEYRGIYRVKEEASHADYVLGLSYARNQNDRIDWGLTTKLIYRKIVDVSAWGIGLDAGMKYYFRDNITAGIVVQDLTGTVLSYSYDNKETINPTLKLGLDLSHQFGNFKGAVLTDADIRFEGRKASAQFYQSWISADTHLGFELSFKDVVAARVGSDIGNLTTGVGLKFSRYIIDIALNDHSDLDTSYRGSLIVEW